MPDQEGCDDLSLRQGEPVHVPEVPGPPQGLRDSSLGGAHGSVLGQRLGRVVQRHTQERESPPNGVSHEGQGNKRYCLMDRAEIQSYSSSLSPRVSHSRRGRKRVPGLNEGSLKHKQALSEKRPAVHSTKITVVDKSGNDITEESYRNRTKYLIGLSKDQSGIWLAESQTQLSVGECSTEQK